MKQFYQSLIVAVLASLSFVTSSFAEAIKPNEPIGITLKGVPAEEQAKIDGQYVVNGSGQVFLPMLDKGVSAAGVTSSELARRIEIEYKSAGIYTNPRVTILTAEDTAKENTLNTKTLTVGGSVRSPGPSPFREGMTLYDAVQAGGGATEFGAINRVKLLRSGKMREYDLKVDANKLIPVYPDDAIEVPQKNWRGN